MKKLAYTCLLLLTCFSAALSAKEHKSHHSSSHSSHQSQGTWEPLVNQPTFLNGATAQLLLTDGSVIVRDIYNHTPGTEPPIGNGNIWKLTPDIYGSYVNGTWSQLATLPAGYEPFYYASAVLPDGRVIIMGGEVDLISGTYVWDPRGAIYDPVANFWTPVSPPPFFNNYYYEDFGIGGPLSVGDAQSVVLADGTFMLANSLGNQAALLDSKTLTWKQTGLNSFGNYTKYDFNDEEGWTLLPNGKVLTVDVYTNFNTPGFPLPYPNYPSNPVNSELYDPSTGTWSTAGSTRVPLTDVIDLEMGPAVLRPDGKVFALGSNGNTAIFDYKKKEWKRGPMLPYVPGEGQLGVQDGPGALLPNGNVLFAAGPISPVYNPPLHVFEFDGKELIEQPTIPNAAIDGSFFTNMLVLPTGQIMMTDTTTDVEIYTPGDKSYNPDWAPVVTSAPDKVLPGETYKIKGKRFNGMSQGAMYGDDYQSATNYPLVRITNLETGHVFYSRTHDHSSMAVASDEDVFTYFDVPANQELGKSKLEVVANGIPSKHVHITVKSH